MRAADCLAAEGISARVVHLPTLRPFPRNEVCSVLAPGMPVITIEEHVGVGGLGPEVARAIAEEGLRNRFSMMAIPAEFQKECLGRQAALAWAGIDTPAIVTRARQVFDPKS
jgi:transketolase